MESGGEVKHLPGCPHFQGGGEAAIDQNSVVPDPEIDQESVEPDQIDQDSVVPDGPQDKYGADYQQAVAGLEGAAQGFLGPAAPWLETKLGVPSEDIAGRAEANPATHGAAEAVATAASMMTGLGEAGLIAKGLEHIPQGVGLLAKAGSIALKGMIEGGLIQGGDEVSKAMLGQADPEAPVSGALLRMGAAGLLNSSTRGVFAAARPIAGGLSEKLESAANKKIADRIRSFSAGFAAASKGATTEDVDKFSNAYLFTDQNVHKKSFNDGMKFYSKLMTKGTKAGAGALGAKVGAATGGLPGIILGEKAGEAAAPYIENMLGKATNSVVTPTLLGAMKTGVPEHAAQLVRYADNIAKGIKASNSAVEALFKSGSQQIVNTNFNDRERTKKFVEDGALNEQMQDSNADQARPLTPEVSGYAAGGAVQAPSGDENNAIAQHFPTHNMMLNAAKGRINSYLNQQRPDAVHQSKLPFDENHKDENASREYDKVIDLANQPLSIFNDLKRGTLTTKTMQHFISMYPECYQYLAKRLTQELTQRQVDTDKPSYKTRQMLSLFLNSPMDQSMSTSNLVAAQGVFAQKRQAVQQAVQEGAAAKPKKGTATLGKTAGSYKTQGQAVESRQQLAK